MAKHNEPSTSKRRAPDKTASSSGSSPRKSVSVGMPAFGAGKLADRAFGAPAEQFGQELARLRTGERAARVVDWIIRRVEATPKMAKFAREFVVRDVLPRLRHVDPTTWLKPKTLLLETVLAGARKSREEPELRVLFARLFASAMDPSASALVHPAFASAADQMAPVDAVVLKFIWQKSKSLNTTGGIPSVAAVWITHPGSYYIAKYRNFIGYPELEGLGTDTTQISISNLERLGIVETQMDRMLGTSSEYESLTDSEFGRNFRVEAQKSGYIADFHRQVLALTPFGLVLCELCIAETSQGGSIDVSSRPPGIHDEPEGLPSGN
jgi:hypothetical protein